MRDASLGELASNTSREAHVDNVERAPVGMRNFGAHASFAGRETKCDFAALNVALVARATME